jgi:ABC-type multidrug transport system fused ATPase/permease subunit
VLEILHAVLFIGILLVAVVYGYSLPVLAAFLVLLNRLQPHLRALEAASTDLESAAANVAEVEWLLDPRGQPPGPTGETPFTGLTDRIEFRDVSFAYPTRTEAAALTKVSFSIPAGQATALMGRSGSGKSTIINLLCRLVDPASGSILVDGKDLAEIDPASWLDQIGIAGQDIDLVDGTIAENIAFGRSGLSEADIVEAARAADAHDFITALPQGYQTHVGDDGSNLSGGQRQRVAIARAFARKPSILILDEATNAVDGISEGAILGLLRRVRGDMTVIVISHRQSTIAQCDHAVSLLGGAVVEESPLSSSESYRKMIDGAAT